MADINEFFAATLRDMAIEHHVELAVIERLDAAIHGVLQATDFDGSQAKAIVTQMFHHWFDDDGGISIYPVPGQGNGDTDRG